MSYELFHSGSERKAVLDLVHELLHATSPELAASHDDGRLSVQERMRPVEECPRLVGIMPRGWEGRPRQVCEPEGASVRLLP